MKRNILGVVLLLILVALIGFYYFDPDQRLHGWLMGEPFYEGRSATAWQLDASSEDENLHAETADRLEAGGNDAEPVLAYLIHAENLKARELAVQALGRIEVDDSRRVGQLLVNALDDADPIVRHVAAKSLVQIGPQYPEAIPALVKQFPDPEMIRAVSAYGEVAADAVPALISLLKSDDMTVRWNAARTLGKIGPAAVSAVPALVADLKHEDEFVREHAAEALGDIGPPAAESVPDLVAVFNDPAWKVRRDAVRSLGNMGPAANKALPEIQKLKQDPQKEVQEAATKAERLVTDSDQNAAERRESDD